jgi:hypothetical protein
MMLFAIMLYPKCLTKCLNEIKKCFHISFVMIWDFFLVCLGREEDIGRGRH